MNRLRSFSKFALAGAVIAAGLRWVAGKPYKAGPSEGEVRHLIDAGRGGLDEGATTLSVLSWNTAWGFGWGSEGTGERRGVSEVMARVEAMGRLLAEVNADVVLLQETDFDSARSGGQDQSEVLARLGGYPWLAPVVSWEVGYLPFPGVDPRGHWGRMRSGGAILSRVPLSDHRIELLPKPAGNNRLYNLFYLGRYFHRVSAQTPWGGVDLGNLHLDAFDSDSRQAQARHIAKLIEQQAQGPLILSGDFNTAPPEASQLHGYLDEPHTDHRGDTTLPTFRALPGMVEARNEGDEAAGFTFPAHAPNRRLDHALVRGAAVVSARVVSEAGDLSDHLPILFEVDLRR